MHRSETITEAIGVCASPKQFAAMMSNIKKIVHDNIKKLELELKLANRTVPKRGIFDRMKNWWYNMLYGHSNASNPYYNRNKLGYWGTPSKKNEMTLHEYTLLKKNADLFERYFDSGRIALDDMLDTWTRDLMSDINSYLQQFAFNHAREMPTKIKNRPEKIAEPAAPVGERPIRRRVKPLRTADVQPAATDQEVPDSSGEEAGGFENISADSPQVAAPVAEPEMAAAVAPSVGEEPAASGTAPPVTGDVSGAEARRASAAERRKLEKSKFDPLNNPAHAGLTLGVTDKKLKESFKAEFDKTTLYERTIICLDKLREIKDQTFSAVLQGS